MKSIILLALLGVSSALAGDRTVSLPLENSAGYPFRCYTVTVQQAGQTARYPGRITKVYYGFTSASLTDYQANNDVAWFNANGEATAAGVFTAVQKHDGGYKGAYFLVPMEVTVPEGRNLVFKLEIEKLNSLDNSVCYGGRHPGATYVETQTYFVEVR